MKFKWLFLFSVLIALTACKNNKRGILTPTSSALPYELLVVIEDSVKETSAWDELRDVLTSPVPGLPQSESSFKLMETNPKHFDGILKPIRNIVEVKIDPKQYTKASMLASKDVYSFPQNIVTLTAPNTEVLAEYLNVEGMAIVQYFTNAEMNRQIAILDKNHSDMASQVVGEMFGANVWLPAELSSIKKGENFVWIGTNSGDVNKYFVMYSIPYTDKDVFTKEYFIHKRDSVLGKNIPGAEEGMYMTTVEEFVDVQPITVQGEYAFEARGLWKMKNDFMGGPFVSQMRYDPSTKNLVFTEVFVFAPEKMKRNLIRPMEASLYTVKFADQLASENPSEENLNDKLDNE